MGQRAASANVAMLSAEPQSVRVIVPSLAYRRCADNRCSVNRFGVTLESLLLEAMQRDYGDKHGRAFTKEITFLPGSTAGGAMCFANPETLLQYRKKQMTRVDYDIRVAELSVFRRVSFESYETLVESKQVRKVALMVHTGCAHIAKKLQDRPPEDEIPFLKQLLEESAAFFRECEKRLSVFCYLVHTDESYVTQFELVCQALADVVEPPTLTPSLPTHEEGTRSGTNGATTSL